MPAIDTIFKNRKLKMENLAPFGFVESEGEFIYSVDLVDSQLELIVKITQEGGITAETIDRLSKEPYILHRISDTTGAFVVRVRKEYENALTAIADFCFEPDIFKSETAKQVIEYVRGKYQDELQFLWKRFAGNAVFRRQDNAKWYAALLTVSKRKLGLEEDAEVEIIDLRAKPENIDALVDAKRYFRGYHMNKKHWLTICLDGAVPIEELCFRIDESFLLAGKS